jgi:riboflavin biosynthesis pyrimidine reductase
MRINDKEGVRIVLGERRLREMKNFTRTHEGILLIVSRSKREGEDKFNNE